jgi:hypothetical protein
MGEMSGTALLERPVETPVFESSVPTFDEINAGLTVLQQMEFDLRQEDHGPALDALQIPAPSELDTVINAFAKIDQQPIEQNVGRVRNYVKAKVAVVAGVLGIGAATMPLPFGHAAFADGENNYVIPGTPTCATAGKTGDWGFLNGTITDIQSDGFLSISKLGEPFGSDSDGNGSAGDTRATMTISQIGTSGLLCATMSMRSNVVGDEAMSIDGSVVTSAMDIPRMDTRLPDGPTGGKLLLPGQELKLYLGLNHAGMAVAGTVTAVDALGPGYVSVHPCGVDGSKFSAVNYIAGAAAANLAMSKVGQDGTICFNTLQAAHVLFKARAFFGADVINFTDPTTGAPVRIMDTRISNYLTFGQKIPAAQDRCMPVGKEGDVALMNLTGITPDASSFFTAHPSTVAFNTVSSLNNMPGGIRANFAAVPIGPNGVCFASSAPTHFAVDLLGTIDKKYVRAADSGGLFLPTRLFDTRVKDGGPVETGSVKLLSATPDVNGNYVHPNQLQTFCEDRTYPARDGVPQSYERLVGFTIAGGLTADPTPGDTVKTGDSFTYEYKDPNGVNYVAGNNVSAYTQNGQAVFSTRGSHSVNAEDITKPWNGQLQVQWVTDGTRNLTAGQQGMAIYGVSNQECPDIQMAS